MVGNVSLFICYLLFVVANCVRPQWKRAKHFRREPKEQELTFLWVNCLLLVEHSVCDSPNTAAIRIASIAHTPSHRGEWRSSYDSMRRERFANISLVSLVSRVLQGDVSE